MPAPTGHNIFSKLTARGVLAQFNQAAATAPNVYEQHATRVASDSPDEEHAWMSSLPKPKEFLGEHSFQGLLDFTYNIVNKEYQLSFVIDKNTMMDDRFGAINRRIAQAAQFWASFKDEQAKDLLEDNTTGPYDGVAFFADTRVIGVSSNVDNNLTLAIAAAANPTTTEFLNVLRLMLTALEEFTDDNGRAGHNAIAAQQLRVIVPPKYRKAATEAINSTIIVNTSNPFGQNLAEIDVLPYLTAANNIVFLMATGDLNSRPLIYQERNPLQINVLNGSDDVALHHGVVVFVNQRYRLQYGEPRRAIKMALTTT